MFWDKKATGGGMSLKKIIVVVILTLTFFFISSVFTDVQGATKQSFEGTSCRAMINVQDFTDSVFTPSFENACATIEREVSLKNKDKDDVLKIVAEAMGFAWWTVNQGKTENLWSDEDGILKSRGVSCLSLVHLYFTDVDKSDINSKITQEDIRDYLKTEKKNDEYTYHEYIQVSGGVGTYEIKSALNFSEEYYVSIASPDVPWIDKNSNSYATAVLFSRTAKTPDECKVK